MLDWFYIELYSIEYIFSLIPIRFIHNVGFQTLSLSYNPPLRRALINYFLTLQRLLNEVGPCRSDLRPVEESILAGSLTGG